MNFVGISKLSLLDYPGKMSAILFTKGCNFSCGYCIIPQLRGKYSSRKIEDIVKEPVIGEVYTVTIGNQSVTVEQTAQTVGQTGQNFNFGGGRGGFGGGRGGFGGDRGPRRETRW